MHGNPTWSYLWRDVVAAAAAAERPWRVVAVDQLEMGWSERTAVPRTVADRVADLGLLTDELGLTGPVVTLGHDWGGIISLGWAVDHPSLTAGVVLTNTALHDADLDALPLLLRLALAPAVTRAGTSSTTAFLDTTLAIAHPVARRGREGGVSGAVRLGRAPRAGSSSSSRDIPAHGEDPSAAELRRIADGAGRLTSRCCCSGGRPIRCSRSATSPT